MCPVCHEPLIAYQLDGIEIDHCLSCLGTWLDAGELEQIGARAGASDDLLERATEVSREGKRTRRRCPRGPHRLREIRMGEDPAVVVDRCPRGHGLWLDRGELRAVIAGSAGDDAERIARFFSELYRSELESNERRSG